MRLVGEADHVDWFCDTDDDITREFAQDISSDVTHITVEIRDLEPLEVTHEIRRTASKNNEQLQSGEIAKRQFNENLRALKNLYHKQDKPARSSDKII